MPRTQYFDDPSAPTPNRIVPAASAAALDDRGALLLEWRQDNGLWALPGGVQEIGESIEQTAVREVREETGIEVEIIGLVGLYRPPPHPRLDRAIRLRIAHVLERRPASY